MRKGMMGIILMSAGILLFIFGMANFISSRKSEELSLKYIELKSEEPKKKSEHSKSGLPISKDFENPKSVLPIPEAPDEERGESKDQDKLEKIIQLAIADGTLTNNERLAIKEISAENNLDYDEVIQRVETKLASQDFESETEVIDYLKKNGNDFEKFVIQKFNKDFFKIKDWAGDKYVEGRYAETTTHPDILLEFKLKRESAIFSVECKWRKNLYKGGVEFANTEQLERYRKYETEKNIPVFVAIGIGGKGSSPEKLYIIPLKDIKSNFIYASKLQHYEKYIDKDFYFDIQTKKLR